MFIDLYGKSYKELCHTEPLSVEEINALYMGFWVYVVNAEVDSRSRLLSGIPVVIGEVAFAGSEDGIYKKYKDPEFGRHYEHILWQPDGFISALHLSVSKNG